jgi:hypothetical protein
MRFFAVLLAALPLLAQHDMSNMPGMEGMHHDMAGMHHDGATEVMEASGTSRNPASSPMNMVHLSAGQWRFMIHGLAFLEDTQQSGPRGRDKLFSTSWFMTEAERRLAGGTFAVRTMLSLEPATLTNRRYPELFQTGETAYGIPIVDGQHPHNFVMELALRYTHPLGEKTTWELYAAPVGDPALGPVAYPHRVSAEEIPQAALGHHLQDSTHISYEVVTAGITHGITRVEASGFHGGEPNENRWTIGSGAIDSYSGRVTVSPNANWSGQISAGRLTRPEALEPGDQTRIEASVTYNRPYHEGSWATSAIWGRVHKTAGGDNLNGYSLESVARWARKNYVTGRIERDDKDELLPSSRNFRIGAYTIGYTRDFHIVPRIATGLGANFTTYSMPAALDPFYGRRPVAGMLFLRFKVREAS